jgi:hypothetical protein
MKEEDCAAFDCDTPEANDGAHDDGNSLGY